MPIDFAVTMWLLVMAIDLSLRWMADYSAKSVGRKPTLMPQTHPIMAAILAARYLVWMAFAFDRISPVSMWLMYGATIVLEVLFWHFPQGPRKRWKKAKEKIKCSMEALRARLNSPTPALDGVSATLARPITISASRSRPVACS